MKFNLEADKLLISNIESKEDKHRLVSIELAILRKIGHIITDPLIDNSTSIHFDSEKNRDVKLVLKSFMITV